MTTFSPLAKIDQAIVRLDAHGLDEASQQLAPFIQVRYVQLQRGGACFDGAAARLGNTFIACAGADRDKLEFIDVPRGRTLIVVPTRGIARLGTACVMPGHAMVAHGPSQLIVYTNHDCRMLFASMPDCWSGKFVNPPPAGQSALRSAAGATVLRLSETEYRLFQRYVHEGLQMETLQPETGECTVFRGVSPLPALEARLADLCDSWLRDLESHGSGTGVSAARCHAAIRARQYIDEHLDQALTLANVCHASYSSPRALEYGFQEIFGVSPKTYMRCARLSRVRCELRLSTRSHGKVTQLAMKWGFWHLSQFSSDYFELFGELPSTTLGRNAARLRRPELSVVSLCGR